ncbi:MAG: response regulator transcription factor [Opitutales bacterium]|nr:response regulator transcription factor [Opitutales bacterium]
MRLLVIEDDPSIQRSLAESLREEQYAVDVADDGQSGLYKALNTAYDCILLDVMLPKLNGWEVLAALREKSTTPVLMLTALGATEQRVKGLNNGADDYLPKPFELDELFARVRALIRRSSGQTQPQRNLRNLTLDTVARRVEVSGKEIPLTAREYVLLEYFMMHPGQVISRSNLYEHLFDEDDDSMSNLLDVHVSNLRRKIGHEFIVTHRGHGYSIQ